MPIPNYETASSLFESYLNIRKDNKEWQLPDDVKIIHKKDVCKLLLQEFQNAKKVNDWMKILDVIADHDREEEAEYTLAKQRYFGMAAYFMDRPLLLETIRATKSYILSQIKTEKEFKLEKDDLVKQKANLEDVILDAKKASVSKDIIATHELQLAKIRDKLDARDDSKDYLSIFFNEVIKVRDPQALQLKEESFKDFEKHIADKSRVTKTIKTMLALSDMTSTKTVNNVLTDKPVQQPVVITMPITATSVGHYKATSAAVVTEHKTEKAVEDNKLNEKKLEEKKLEEKKLEEKKLEEKKLEEKKLQEKKLAEKKLAEKKLEEKKLQEKKLEEKKLEETKLEEKKLTPKKLEQKKFEEKKPDNKQYKDDVFDGIFKAPSTHTLRSSHVNIPVTSQTNTPSDDKKDLSYASAVSSNTIFAPQPAFKKPFKSALKSNYYDDRQDELMPRFVSFDSKF